jgi:hypothetical protein
MFPLPQIQTRDVQYVPTLSQTDTLMFPLSHTETRTNAHSLSLTPSGDVCPIASTFETDGRFTPLFTSNTYMRLPHLYITDRNEAYAYYVTHRHENYAHCVTTLQET